MPIDKDVDKGMPDRTSAGLSRRFRWLARLRPDDAHDRPEVPILLIGRSAAVLAIICGAISLASVFSPLGRGANVTGVLIASGAAIALGTITWFLPWNAWPRSSTHLIVPVGFAMVAMGLWYYGDLAYSFGFIFCASFTLVGVAHRRGTSLLFLPLFAAAYIIPIALKTGDWGLATSLAVSVGVVCALISETLAWLTGKLQRSQQALLRTHAAVNDISADLTSMDPEDLAWSASARLSKLLDVPDVDVYSLAEDGALICLARIVNHEPCLDQRTRREDLGSWKAGAEAVCTKESVSEQSPTRPDPHTHTSEKTHVPRGPTSLAIPLVARNKAVGLVEVIEGREGRTISLEKIATAGPVCRLIALSIQDAQAFAAKQQQSNKLASMLESSRAVTSADNLEDGLAILTRRAADVLGVCECVAYEYMREVDAIIARAMWEKTPTGWDRIGEVLPLGDYPSEKACLSSGLALLENISDPELDPKSQATMAEWGEKCCLTVPMRSAEGPMGLLAFWDSERERHFSDEEMALATGLAELAGESVRRAKLLRSLQRLSGTDSLTGLANHRQVHEMLAREQARAERHGLGFGLVMLDIDGFKLLNDTYGHPCGDTALRHVAAILQANARASDVVGRYGGDEFVLILSETQPAEATLVIEKLRAAFAEKPFITPTGEKIPIHASFGIAVYPEDGHNVNELVVAADANLYVSKRRGGNSVTGVGHDEPSEVQNADSFGILESMVTAVDNKDKYTRHHSDEVTEYALALAAALGLSDSSLRVVRAGGLLHDVGKIGIPDRILRKPGRLTTEEWAIVKGHPSMGETLVRTMPDLSEIQGLVASHHERFDGTGYPRGLAGAEIPLLARILAVVDAFSAMTTDRPYRKALTREEAIAELRAGAGSHFDPGIASAFIQCLENPPGEMPHAAAELASTAPAANLEVSESLV
jgi:diguanylate cyclase (GGDEF)-like protein/putative nucleotidyltransferase with HDIG domain